ncbi:kinase-like protein [Sistotremastrum suecicum HHB10207 ss-3]|uniref:Kinase-like protein n=1 Tax=Sistotremastrum suecicum HHB10207 ss-3 TaxID=1314776 RepID=A0A166ERI7_9AGAM|nr:kinase-like protein [Sistotremastrum suecicum HHB10207 ss-3]
MESRFASQESLWRSINENPPELKGVTKESRNPVATTNFSEVYRGSWLPPDRGVFGTRMLVAIKVIRTIPGASAARQEQTLRQLKREITLQERLKHENILPFLGVSMDFGDLPSPISEWMANGTVLQYLKKNPQASRLDFLKGIARGMRFLHQPTPHKPSIVHGDLKGSNILVTNWGAPCLADFGLSRVYDPATFWNTATESVNGTTRWMSPELLSASNDRKSLTIASDIYAYGITAWEIVTGKLPYHDLIDTKVILEVTKGLRPTRPRDISDALWNVMQQCWDVDVKVRPSMGSVLRAFHKIAEMNPPLRLLSLGTSS